MPRMPWSSRISASWPSRNSSSVSQAWPVVVRDVLARVLADRAGAGRLVARRVLRAAGPAEVRRHQDRARAARRTRRAACAGTCRPDGRARGGSRSRRRAAWRRSRAWSGCTRRRRCFGAPISPRRFSALPARPARGGSTTTTSGSPARVAQVGQHLADVAGEERAVADRVQLLVLDRAGDRLLADLDPPHRHRVAGHREADRADAAVEVVDRLAAGQPGVLARDRVELLRHLRVRLQEGVRAHAEAQAADLLLDRILAPEQLGRQVRHLGDAAVDRPVDRLAPRGTRSAPRSGARGRSARRASVTSCTSIWPVFRPSRTTRWRR